jgi:rhomboid protease GluP
METLKMPVTRFLLYANFFVFAYYLYLSSGHGLFNYVGSVLLEMGAAFGPRIIGGHEYWRLLASLFLHANIQHVVLNMTSLFLFGPRMEKALGGARYFVLYMFSGLFGALVSLAMHPMAVSVGASGAILGLVGFYIFQQFHLDKQVHPSMSYRLRQLIGMAIALYCLSLTPGVDNAAHMGGIFAGIVCGGAFQKFSDFGKLWSGRDFVLTMFFLALLLAAFYGERRYLSHDKGMQASILIHESTELIRQKNLAQGKRMLDQALSLDPGNERGLWFRSDIYYLSGQYDLALADINAALAINSKSAIAFNQRASINLALGHYGEAVADAKRAIELDKNLTPAFDSEAVALSYSGQYDLALPVADQAIKAEEGSDQAGIYFYHRAQIYAALGEQAKAQADFAQAKKLGFMLESWEPGRPLPLAQKRP